MIEINLLIEYSTTQERVKVKWTQKKSGFVLHIAQVSVIDLPILQNIKKNIASEYYIILALLKSYIACALSSSVRYSRPEDKNLRLMFFFVSDSNKLSHSNDLCYERYTHGYTLRQITSSYVEQM